MKKLLSMIVLALLVMAVPQEAFSTVKKTRKKTTTRTTRTTGTSSRSRSGSGTSTTSSSQQSRPQSMTSPASDYYQKAMNGDAAAQFNLGECYALGRGVEKDYSQAVYWYRKAAEQGVAIAQWNLGLCYANGKGVEKDYSQAVYWYRKAAEQGSYIAGTLLGQCYENGDGVNQDYSQAVYWYRKAAENDFSNGSPEYFLGKCYAGGKGVSQDYTQAVYWWRKSAEHDYAPAQYSLGNCYADGKGVIKDEPHALYWYKKALEHSESLSNMDLYVIIELISSYEKEGFVASSTPASSSSSSSSSSSYSSSSSSTPSYSGSSSSTTSTSTTYSTPTYNYSYSSEPKKRFFGFSAGYVQKQWQSKAGGEKEKMGFWDDSKVVHGVQAGLRVEPYFKFGLGLNTGVLYEFYYTKSQPMTIDGYNVYGEMQEHALYMPVHLAYRLKFNEFHIYAFGGVGMDYGISSKVTLKENGTGEAGYSNSPIYETEDAPDWKRFNASYEFGGGLRYKLVEVQFTMSRGFLNMSHTTDYKLYQNKPMMVSLGFMF